MPKTLKKCMKLNWNFQTGWGALEKIPSVGGGVDIFWKYTLLLHLTFLSEFSAEGLAFLNSLLSRLSGNFFSVNYCTIFPGFEIFRILVPTAVCHNEWCTKMGQRVICGIVWLLFIYSTFSNSLIIHQVKTNKIPTVKEVWIPGPN